MTVRPSLTRPLQMADVTAPQAKGAIGVTFCPGKKQASVMSGVWDRDLGIDLDTIKTRGADTIITPIEPHEIEHLKVTEIGQEAKALGMVCIRARDEFAADCVHRHLLQVTGSLTENQALKIPVFMGVVARGCRLRN